MNYEKNMFSNLLYNYKPINENQIITGIIVAISKDTLYIDIGSKETLKFKKSEIYPTINNAMNELQVGSKIPLLFETYEKKISQKPILSYEKAEKINYEKSIWNYIENKSYITGRIFNAVNGGYSVGLGGLVAFLPKNHLGPFKEKTIGQLKTFSVLKLNSQNQNVIVSRLNALEAWKRKRKN